jgi:hypothetical protein
MVCEDLQSKSVVKCAPPWHIILFITNIVLPGIGTILSSCCASKFNVMAVAIGLCQLITAPIIIGWVWSIYWGYLIYAKTG